MKVHKVTFYIIDFDNVGLDGAVLCIENARYSNYCIAPVKLDGQSVEIGEWRDDHPLNRFDTAKDEILRLFPATGIQGERHDG